MSRSLIILPLLGAIAAVVLAAGTNSVPPLPVAVDYQTSIAIFSDGSTGTVHYPPGVILGPEAESPSNPPPEYVYVVTNTVFRAPSKVRFRIQTRTDLASTNWIDLLVYDGQRPREFFKITIEDVVEAE